MGLKVVKLPRIFPKTYVKTVGSATCWQIGGTPRRERILKAVALRWCRLTTVEENSAPGGCCRLVISWQGQLTYLAAPVRSTK
jgi:hypothetical protein